MKSKLSSLVLIVTLLVMLVSDVGHCASQKEVEEIRRNLVEKFGQADIPPNIKSDTIALLKDDTKTLSEDIALKAFAGDHNDKAIEAQRQAYIFLWLFKNRDDATKISSFYEKLPKGYRGLYLSIFDVFYKPFITKELWILGQSALQDAVQWMQEAQGKPQEINKANSFTASVLWFLSYTKSENALPAINKVLTERIVNPGQRFLIVSTASGLWKKGAADLVKWYFNNYAYHPFEVQTFAKYLLIYVESVEAENLIRNKYELLNESSKNLSGLVDVKPESK